MTLRYAWNKTELTAAETGIMVTKSGVEPDPCFSEILARITFVLIILARGQKSL